MARLRYNGLAATLGAALASGSSTAVTFAAALTHSGGTAVPTITGTDCIPLTILDATGKLAEVVYLTAYTAGATTGTISRAQEGTTAAARASGLVVVNAPTVLDSSAGLTVLRRSADQAISANVNAAIVWDVEDRDDLALHDTVTNASRVTVPTGKAGYYLFTFDFGANGTPSNWYMFLWKNGAQSGILGAPQFLGSIQRGQMTKALYLADGDYVEAMIFCPGAITAHKDLTNLTVLRMPGA